MFGTNPIRKRDPSDLGFRLQVQDVWYTIQGEGLYAGQPAVFIRLTGCNLACFFCDTHWDDANDPRQSVREIVQRALAAAPPHCSLVVLTGGEPTRQTLEPLLDEFDDQAPGRFTVQIETNGTFWQPAFLRSNVRIVVSPKTPKIHPEILAHAHAFKYVVRAGENGADGLPMRSTQHDGELVALARPRRGAMVFLSPCDEHDEERNQMNRRQVGILALEHGYTVSLQMHKYLDLP